MNPSLWLQVSSLLISIFALFVRTFALYVRILIISSILIRSLPCLCSSNPPDRKPSFDHDNRVHGFLAKLVSLSVHWAWSRYPSYVINNVGGTLINKCMPWSMYGSSLIQPWSTFVHRNPEVLSWSVPRCLFQMRNFFSLNQRVIKCDVTLPDWQNDLFTYVARIIHCLIGDHERLDVSTDPKNCQISSFWVHYI
jgi:hypothetical protein